MNAKINKKLFFILLIPLAYLIQFLSSRASGLAEKIYSRGVYRIIARFLNLISGHIPVSIAEILVVLSILFALFYIVKTIIRMINPHQKLLKFYATPSSTSLPP